MKMASVEKYFKSNYLNRRRYFIDTLYGIKCRIVCTSRGSSVQSPLISHELTRLPGGNGDPHLWNTSLLATVTQEADTPNFTWTAGETADKY